MTEISGIHPAPVARCWTLCDGRESVDIELTAHDADTVADVLPALGRALGRSVEGLWHGSTRLSDDRPLTAPELGHGAVLGCGAPVGGADAVRPSSALELHVVGGPAAGETLPLGQGRHVVGRGGDASVQLDDPDVSRLHVAVQVGAGAISVADLGSTNGSRLGGRDLGGEAMNWPSGAVLHLGASALTVSGPCGTSAALEPAPGGRLRLRPTPRMTAPPCAVEVVFPKHPAAAPRRRLAWVAIALPALGGVAMATLLHAPTFLFFALLSPVVALGTWLSERLSGRRSGRRDAAAHALEVVAAESRLAAAVEADLRVAAAAHPDPATLTTAARRRSRLLWSRPGSSGELPVRLGIGPGETRVTRVGTDGARVRETAGHTPVVVDLAVSGGLAVLGPRERALGVLSTVVAQLVTLHPPGEVDLLLLTTPRRLRDWCWARWLPHLDPRAVHARPGSTAEKDESLHAWLTALVGHRRAAMGGLPESAAARPGQLVVLVDRPLDPRIARTLRSARDLGIVSLTAAEAAEDLPVPVDTHLRLGGETGDQAVLSRHGAPDRTAVTVDRMPRRVAAALARDLARLVPAGTATGLPRSVRLLDLPQGGLPVRDDAMTGTWSRERDSLVATVGRTAHGPVQVDLCREGPHALVAGTTGSGKSELLQTMIAALALNHPPDRCSFLLVDYKGGAAFAEAAGLPHTVGLVTDLDGQTTERALRSLSAELARREAVLAVHAVADISALPDEVPMARLVIVVDEFAGLAEELPAFVPGLVGIAQRGRSLGVHLVLATQRPSGVVSPEIRANCTMRICLRTTDEADSRDVLGTIEAAHLPVDLPGRAYLRSGSGPTTALQVARIATSVPRQSAARPEVRLWSWPAVLPAAAPSADDDQPSDLARVCEGLAQHAAVTGSPLPHRPWCPPLPDQIHAADLQAGHEPGKVTVRLPIGLMDQPDDQSQQVLGLDLGEGGTWLAVGGSRSGRSTLLRTVLSEAVRRLGPDELHVHVLQPGGSLAAEAAVLPHTGTTVGGEDALRTVRLVDRLLQEVTERRAATMPERRPRILLLIDGAEAITTLLDESDPGRGSANLLRLLRDGAAAGLTCVVTADRAVPGGRLAAAAQRRLVLPLPDRADYAVAGIASRAVPGHRPPGRALVGEEALECQLALPRPFAPAPRRGHPGPAPLRIPELMPDPVLTLSPGSPETAGTGSLRLPVGPGGDEGQLLVVDLLRSGGLLVSGPPGSGRSTALDAFDQELRSRGVAVLRVGCPDRDCPTPDLAGTVWLDPADEAGLTAWLAGRAGRPGAVIADDVGAPSDFPVLARLPAPGSGSGVVLLAAAGPGQLTAHYQGPVAALRRGRTGLLLCPGQGDADLLGVRLPRCPLPVRPGSGWLVSGSGIERVQVARRARLDDPGPRAAPLGPSGRPVPPEQRQRRSSAGPISWRAYQASS